MRQTLLNERYELEEKIGEGGMAAVYRGRDQRLNRVVAIKILYEHYAIDPDFLNRFQHEAQAAAILSHPGVVNVYDVGQDGSIHYIVMEYVDGENLKSLINREAPLPVAQAVAIAEAVAYGLESAHRIGLIHRDIKPQNILITKDGHVRITDFGIAKSHLSTALTDTGITFGTADYISPEQARGEGATPQSDIYALGVTLYEMLAGRLPFTGDSAVSIAMQHVNSAPPSVRQFNPLVPPQLEALIGRALAKDSPQRPASAREFAQMLQHYRILADQPTLFTPRIMDSVPQHGGSPRLSGAVASPAGTVGRGAFPPPRPAVNRVPRRQGQGCGVMVFGILLLSGLLGLALLFSIGAITPLPVPITPTVTPTRFPPTATQTPPSVATARPTATPRPTTTSTPELIPTVTPLPLPTFTPEPTPVPLVTVPDIRNLPENDARAYLLSAQLVPVLGESRYDSNVPQGWVIDQLVPARSDVPIGTIVTYSLSLGPELIEVPNVVQRRLEDALAELQRLGLNANVSEEPSQEVSESFIMRQDPNPGARVRAGETIFVTISIGDKTRFPAVVGQDRFAAEQAIREAGLNLIYVDPQGRDRLPDFARYRPNEVVSALANGQPVRNGDYIPRNSNIVLGVRAVE